MHPAQQLKRDTLILALTIATSLTLVYIIMSVDMGYAPADECANNVRSALSPYQVQQLTEAAQLPPKYNTVRLWCESNPVYRSHILNAQTWPMFPAHTDMIAQ
jgi:hypothetical protein